MPIIMQSIYSKQSELYNVSSFQTTYIYNPRDFLSTISALLALLPLEVVVVYLTLIYCRREVEVILIYIGQIICQLLNVHLKEKIQQPRPNPLIKGYGMPSNHAQFTSYFTGYMILWMFFRARYLPKIYYTRNTIVLAFLLISICFSRVYFKYHTIWQVIVGVLVGTAFSTIWFFLVSIIRHLGIVNWLLHSKLNAYFYIKDTMNEEHQLIEKEWQDWKQKQVIQQKKVMPAQS